MIISILILLRRKILKKNEGANFINGLKVTLLSKLRKKQAILLRLMTHIQELLSIFLKSQK